MHRCNLAQCLALLTPGRAQVYDRWFRSQQSGPLGDADARSAGTSLGVDEGAEALPKVSSRGFLHKRTPSAAAAPPPEDAPLGATDDLTCSAMLDVLAEADEVKGQRAGGRGVAGGGCGREQEMTVLTRCSSLPLSARTARPAYPSPCL